MIKIEFPADRPDIASAIGKALSEIGGDSLASCSGTHRLSVDDTDEPYGQTHCPDDAPHELADKCGPYEDALRKAGHPYDRSSEGTFSRALLVLEQQALERDFTLPSLTALAKAIPVGDMERGNMDAVVDKLRWYVGFTDPDPKQDTAESAEDTSDSTQAETTTAAADTGNPDGGELDEKGVARDPAFCSKAAIPFYGSGKKKGQWKKRQGVDESAYDDWYDQALADLKFAGDVVTEDEPEDVAANAFGNKQTAPQDEKAPQDAGQLMVWVSEQQAAGNITQEQVTAAYSDLSLPFDAIMNPSYPVAQNCASIYNHLKGQI